jgi:hypothetical protein
MGNTHGVEDEDMERGWKSLCSASLSGLTTRRSSMAGMPLYEYMKCTVQAY